MNMNCGTVAAVKEERTSDIVENIINLSGRCREMASIIDGRIYPAKPVCPGPAETPQCMEDALRTIRSFLQDAVYTLEGINTKL